MANTIKSDKKVCITCERERPMREFYVSNSRLFKDGRVNMCKSCVKNDLDELNLPSIKRILRELDRPYIESIWNQCLESEKDTLGWYLRQVSTLPQYKDLTYEDSVQETSQKSFNAVKSESVEYPELETKELVKETGFEVSNDLRLKWGVGYNDFEYMKMEDYWKKMRASNDISTPQSLENLEILAKLKIEMNRLIADKDYQNFERVSRQYANIMKDSGIRPIDKASSAESQGIRTFGQIFEEVEKDGFILPPPITESQDIVDATILYLLRYNQKLFNQEQMVEAPADTPKVEDYV